MVAELMDRKLRKDALPEDMHYVDRGCRLHPRCLTCPFERCRFEGDGPHRGPLTRSPLSPAELLELQNAGMSIDALAEICGLGRRQVFRYLERARG